MISAVLSAPERTIKRMTSERGWQDQKPRHSCLYVEFTKRCRCQHKLSETCPTEQGRS